MTNLKVTNLVQNKYVYRVLKTKPIRKSNIVSSIVIFVLCIATLYGMSVSNNNYTTDIVSTISYINNPIDPLYSDMGDIVFTSSDGIVKLDEGNDDYTLPVTYRDYTIGEKCIEFDIASPLVCSIEKGVVSDIYVIGNNIKCIKIKHSRNVYSILENVDILGVHIGALVSKGQKLGTASMDSKIKLYLEVNGELKDISISGKSICVN